MPRVPVAKARSTGKFFRAPTPRSRDFSVGKGVEAIGKGIADIGKVLLSNDLRVRAAKNETLIVEGSEKLEQNLDKLIDAQIRDKGDGTKDEEAFNESFDLLVKGVGKEYEDNERVSSAFKAESEKLKSAYLRKTQATARQKESEFTMKKTSEVRDTFINSVRLDPNKYTATIVKGKKALIGALGALDMPKERMNEEIEKFEKAAQIAAIRGYSDNNNFKSSMKALKSFKTSFSPAEFEKEMNTIDDARYTHADRAYATQARIAKAEKLSRQKFGRGATGSLMLALPNAYTTEDKEKLRGVYQGYLREGKIDPAVFDRLNKRIDAENVGDDEERLLAFKLNHKEDTDFNGMEEKLGEMFLNKEITAKTAQREVLKLQKLEIAHTKRTLGNKRDIDDVLKIAFLGSMDDKLKDKMGSKQRSMYLSAYSYAEQMASTAGSNMSYREAALMAAAKYQGGTDSAILAPGIPQDRQNDAASIRQEMGKILDMQDRGILRKDSVETNKKLRILQNRLRFLDTKEETGKAEVKLNKMIDNEKIDTDFAEANTVLNSLTQDITPPVSKAPFAQESMRAQEGIPFRRHE